MERKRKGGREEEIKMTKGGSIKNQKKRTKREKQLITGKESKERNGLVAKLAYYRQLLRRSTVRILNMPHIFLIFTVTPDEYWNGDWL